MCAPLHMVRLYSDNCAACVRQEVGCLFRLLPWMHAMLLLIFILLCESSSQEDDGL